MNFNRGQERTLDIPHGIALNSADLHVRGSLVSLDSRGVGLEVPATRLDDGGLALLNKNVTVELQNGTFTGTVQTYTMEGLTCHFGIRISRTPLKELRRLLSDDGHCGLAKEGFCH